MLAGKNKRHLISRDVATPTPARAAEVDAEMPRIQEEKATHGSEKAPPLLPRKLNPGNSSAPPQRRRKNNDFCREGRLLTFSGWEMTTRKWSRELTTPTAKWELSNGNSKDGRERQRWRRAVLSNRRNRECRRSSAGSWVKPGAAAGLNPASPERVNAPSVALRVR